MASASLPWAVFTTLLVTLIIAIFLRQGASRVGRRFCVMLVFVAIWFLGFAVMLGTHNSAVAEGWGLIAVGAIAFLPAAMYDFSVTALRLTPRRTGLATAFWVLSTIAAGLILFTPFIVSASHRYPWGRYPRFTRIGGGLFVLYIVGAFALHFAEHVMEARETEDAKRRQRIHMLMISFAIAYLCSVDLIPMFGIDRRPIAYVPLGALLIFSWRSIQSHRLRPLSMGGAAREILATMADALFVLDRDARISAVNPAVQKILGYAEWEVIGKSIDVLESIDVERTISKTLREMVRRGAVRDQERVFRHKEGDLIDVSISVSPVLEGNVEAGAILIARDIRQRKRAEEDLRAFTLRLQQSNRELEDFAYVASHDLQEPLRKIQAFGDRLREKAGPELNAEGRDYIDRMQSAARRMQTLIDDLLTFARVTTKAKPFVAVDLKQVVDEAAHDLEARVLETGGQVMVGDLPVIEADPVQMRQLFLNLIGNALKFHRPSVPPKVEVRGTNIDGHCEIRVSDNGIGFDEKYADRIFAMFERLHGRNDYQGTGIGLAICRKIAERHSGEIVASSRPGEGSTFVVTLPVRHSPSERFDAA